MGTLNSVAWSNEIAQRNGQFFELLRVAKRGKPNYRASARAAIFLHARMRNEIAKGEVSFNELIVGVSWMQRACAGP
jgi:hypothetical protein